MGFDCTLHLVDARVVREQFVPWFLGRGGDASRFEAAFPDANALREKVRAAIAEGSPGAGGLLCQLAVMFVSADLPHVYERGFALSLWPELPGGGASIPDSMTASPSTMLGDIVSQNPKLRLPRWFESNYSTGVFIPSDRIEAALAWVTERVERLEKGDRGPFLGLLRVLRAAKRLGHSYWEATDLKVASSHPELLEEASTTAAGVQICTLDIYYYSAVLAEIDGEFVLGDGERFATHFVDLKTWPPRVVTCPGLFSIGAARAPSGEWMVDATDDRNARPRLFAPYRFPAGFDPPTPHRLPVDTDLATASFDGVAFVGAVCALFPREQLTLDGSLPHPFVLRGDRFGVESSLPSAVGYVDAIKTRHVFNGAAITGDGTDVLIWDGNGFSLRDAHWARVFEMNAQQREMRLRCVPTANGFVYVAGRLICEARRDAEPTIHLPMVTNVMQIAEGPDGAILVQQGQNKQGDLAKLCFMAEGRYASLTPEMLGLDGTKNVSAVAYVPVRRSVIVLIGDVVYSLPIDVLLEAKRVKPRGTAKGK